VTARAACAIFYTQSEGESVRFKGELSYGPRFRVYICEYVYCDSGLQIAIEPERARERELSSKNERTRAIINFTASEISDCGKPRVLLATEQQPPPSPPEFDAELF